jgi:ATP-dependent DNA helicase RecG
MTPIYPSTAGLANSALQKLIGKALASATCPKPCPTTCASAETARPGPQPEASCTRRRRAPISIRCMPRNHPAWRRVKFDEVLAQQLSLRRAYLARREQGRRCWWRETISARACSTASLRPDRGAAAAMAEIADDLAQPHPMQRLLQGDVGAGKTIVAALAACQAISAGWQAAFMAPTEILAEQHYLKSEGLAGAAGRRGAWLSGSLKSKAKREQLAATAARRNWSSARTR